MAKKNNELRTYEEYLTAVSDGKFSLEYVPEEYKTAEMCLAVIHRGGSLEYVPDEHKTADLYYTAVEQGDWYIIFQTFKKWNVHQS